MGGMWVCWKESVHRLQTKVYFAEAFNDLLVVKCIIHLSIIFFSLVRISFFFVWKFLVHLCTVYASLQNLVQPLPCMSHSVQPIVSLSSPKYDIDNVVNIICTVGAIPASGGLLSRGRTPIWKDWGCSSRNICFDPQEALKQHVSSFFNP